jgi:hypothetical protein
MTKTIRPTEYPAMISDLRRGFEQDLTRPLAWRAAQLDAISRMLEENEDRIGATWPSPIRRSTWVNCH